MTKTNVAAMSRNLSPVRKNSTSGGSSGFRSPLIERAQEQASSHRGQRPLQRAAHSPRSPTRTPVRIAQDAQAALPVPPSLPFGTVLVSPTPLARSAATGSTSPSGRGMTAAFTDKENTPRSRSRINADRRALSPAERRSGQDSEGTGANKASLESSLKQDQLVKAAIRDADAFLQSSAAAQPQDHSAETSVLSPAKQVRICKKGWVSKDSGVVGLSTPHWQRRFLMLERDSRLLKFSNSELAEHYPSQVRGLLALHPATTSIRVTKAAQSGAFSSYFSGAAANLLEVTTTMEGKENSLRLQFETMGELSSWQKAIENVMAGVR